MHQVPLAYMVAFCQASFEPGFPGTELSAHLTCPPRGDGQKDLELYYKLRSVILYYHKTVRISRSVTHEYQ